MTEQLDYAVKAFDLIDIKTQAEKGLNPLVPYSPDELEMTKAAVVKMQHCFDRILSTVNSYIEPTL